MTGKKNVFIKFYWNPACLWSRARLSKKKKNIAQKMLPLSDYQLGKDKKESTADLCLHFKES